MHKLQLTLLTSLALPIASFAQSLPRVYDETRNPVAQIDSALAVAKNDGKFVVCQVGGNWCPWCLRFADFVKNDSTISRVVSDNYVYIHVNYNPRRPSNDPELAAQTAQMMKRLNNPSRFGYPVFIVLDEEGRVIHTQDSSFLEEGKGYSSEKVVRFFRSWTPSSVNGTQKQ